MQSYIMVTRAQIEEIQAESLGKGISIKQVLQEKGIPAHQYFWWKRKYSRPDIPEGFLPIAGGVLPAGMSVAMGAATPRGKQKGEAVEENWMTIELRTGSGTDMRIQGGLTPAMLYTILKSI